MSHNAQKEDYNENYVDAYLIDDGIAKLHDNVKSTDLTLAGLSSPDTQPKETQEKQTTTVSVASDEVTKKSLKSTGAHDISDKKPPSNFISDGRENTLGSLTSEKLLNKSTGWYGKGTSEEKEFEENKSRSLTRETGQGNKYSKKDYSISKATTSPRSERSRQRSKNSQVEDFLNSSVNSQRSHAQSKASVSMSFDLGPDQKSLVRKSTRQQQPNKTTQVAGDRRHKPHNHSVVVKNSSTISKPTLNRTEGNIEQRQNIEKLPEIPASNIRRKPPERLSVSESIERLSIRKGRDFVKENERRFTQTANRGKFNENWTRVNSDNSHRMSGITLQPSISNDHRSRHGPSLDDSMPFLKEDKYTNLILIVDGKKLFTNRCILGYCSPYFQKILDNAAKAAVADKKKKAEVKISDRTYSDMVELLNYLHPATSSEISEKSALRLLPMANDYGITALKERCERVLVGSLRMPQVTSKNSRGPSTHKGKKDNAPDMLMMMKCIKCADAAESKGLLDECVRIFSNPDVPLKDLKASNDVSDQVKAKIYENRMESTASKVNKLQSELTKEKQQNEALQKEIQERLGNSNSKQRNNRIQRSGSDPSLDVHRKSNNQVTSNGPTQRAHKTPRT